jgi:2,4-dienoyl-CoA reductase-like NADH-dependent reductase (Old Yellow Enzyme family)
MKNYITLFDPIQVGDLHLPNRIFMAPLTRLRGTADNLATPIMAEYYSQRASAGLIISESIAVDPLGVGYHNVPGLWNQRQIQSWRPVTDAVHKGGGHIYAQLWHAGRASDPSLLNGERPVGPSAIPATGTVRGFIAIDLREIGHRQ